MATFTGTSGNDILLAGAGNDLLEGLVGDDLLLAGSGNDELFGNDGADTLAGGSGNDTLEGGNGPDLLDGEEGNDSIVGGNGADTILGRGGNDIINGGDGDDLYIISEGGDDILQDSGGIDTLDASLDRFGSFIDLTPGAISFIDGGTVDLSGFIVGDNPDVVFIVDISGSTSATFGGSPVGDLNGDGLSDTILDAEIAGFIALNNQLIAQGFGNIADISVVAFDDVAFQVGDTATPLTDSAIVNSVSDVEDNLRSLDVGGLTDFEAALQEAIDIFTTLGTPFGEGNVVFLSDGFPTSGGSTAEEVAALNALGVNLRAFGVGSSASLTDLQLIDPTAEIFTDTDELLDVFGDLTPGGGQSALVENAIGGDFADTIIGNFADNQLWAGDGSDQVFGEDGNDTILGGNGRDLLLGGPGNDLISGEGGDDVMDGGSGNDTFKVYGGGDDFVEDPSGIDTLDASMSQTGTTIDLAPGAVSFIDGGTVTLGSGGTLIPLDVLLLEDLSGSFFDDLPVVTGVLPSLLSGLTAIQPDTFFGISSFIDKPVSPFGGPNDYVYRTEQSLLAASVAGNVTTLTTVQGGLAIGDGNDLPESQLEALLQTAVRPGEIGFRDISRKVVVLTTDAEFHTAGDGVDADGDPDGVGGNGIQTPNDGDSILDLGGVGEDYPEILQVRDALLAADVVPIFAVTSDQLTTYQGLVGDLGFGDVVELESDSSNLVDAITAGLSLINQVFIENAIGSDFNDTIRGNDLNNLLDGRSGNDSILGLAGNDTLQGGDGNDTLNGGAGNDTLNGGNNNDVLSGGDNNDSLNGGEGNDTLNGGTGSDSLDGALGNDSLIGGDGSDTFSGGDGLDTLDGGNNNDSINGGSGNDSLLGGEGNDTLNGGNDNDILNAGNGTDSLLGGSGNDTLRGEGNPDTLRGGDGNDRLEGGDANDLLNGENNDDTLIGGGGADSLDGASGNDSLDGSGANDSINGGAGFDTLTGGDGDDAINGGNDTDRLVESGDVNFVLTNATLTGNGNDTLVSIEEAQLTGGVGNNSIDTSAFTGIVFAIGGDGNDAIGGGSGNDSLEGGNGNDTVNGGAGNDTVNGGASPDTLNGGGGDDVLLGTGGNDTLNGGGNNDSLTGGSGTDTLTGGTGVDSFIYNLSNEGIDTITDFSVVDDTIRVSAAGFGGGLVAGAVIPAGQFVVGAGAGDANDRFIYNNANGRLFFDVDGTGAAGQVQLATLTGIPALTNADIFVIA